MWSWDQSLESNPKFKVTIEEELTRYISIYTINKSIKTIRYSIIDMNMERSAKEFFRVTPVKTNKSPD